MSVKSIKNNDDLKTAFIRLESIFQAEEDTPEANEREMLVTLISAYEDKYYPIDDLVSHKELTVNNADRDMLMNLLENPRPANDAMKNLMGVLDEK
ncbi:DUF1778 domain-containing protein [Acinetobacter sp.]|jgi:HTH-type transcriptional regulator/antitoxin HigA|uniref:DUF1778 domain-containing protein n=1 Tax=Acinetobacter sp. TaxID=472 RepID=UPI003D085F19